MRIILIIEVREVGEGSGGRVFRHTRETNYTFIIVNIDKLNIFTNMELSALPCYDISTEVPKKRSKLIHFDYLDANSEALNLGEPTIAGLDLQWSDALDVWLEASLQQQNKSLELPIRCYNHGCNGRTFSSKGNYQRHLKEQNGAAPKFLCPTCGRMFSRSSARNKHYKEQRCFNAPRGIPMRQAPFIIPTTNSMAASTLVIPNNDDHALAPVEEEALSIFGTAGGFGSSSTSGSDLAIDDHPALYDPFFEIDQASSTSASISDINTPPATLCQPPPPIENYEPHLPNPTRATSWTQHDVEPSGGVPIRCFEHGCVGRSFSTIGNYRRHLKERSGYTAKFLCPRCGRTFSRSTARNTHEKKRNCGNAMS